MKLCREGNPGWVGQTTFWCEYGNPVLDAIFSFDWTRKACVACPHPLLMNGNPVLNVPSFLSKMEVLYCQLYPICLKQENLLFVHVKRSSSYTSRFISRLKGRPVQNAPSSLLVKGCPVKEVCHKIFEPLFFSWFVPIWAPDKQPKVFFEFGFDFAEIFDHKVISAVCNIRQR